MKSKIPKKSQKQVAWELLHSGCEICGRRYALHTHHVVSRRIKETKDEETNWVRLCFECHGKVHSGKIKLFEISEKFPNRIIPPNYKEELKEKVRQIYEKD